MHKFLTAAALCAVVKSCGAQIINPGTGTGGATLPSSGVVCATSTTSGVACTPQQLVNQIGNAYAKTVNNTAPDANGNISVTGAPVPGISSRQSDNAVQVTREVLDRPHVDVTSTSSSWYTNSGCPNAAVSSSSTDSSCAVNAAIAYAWSLGKADSGAQTAPCVYFPPGLYQVNNLRVPLGVPLCADSQTATLQLNDPTNSLIVEIGTAPPGQSGNIGAAGAPYSPIIGLKLLGGANTTGALLEIDNPFVLVEDVTFNNTSGYGVVANPGNERLRFDHVAFYNLAQPVLFSGDNNESVFTAPHGLAGGQDANGHCYSINCVNGSIVAAGTSGSPTAIYGNQNAIYDIRRTDSVTIENGDAKSNLYSAALRLSNTQNATWKGMYDENVQYGTGQPSLGGDIVLNGAPPKTTITGTVTTTTVGGNTVYAFPVASNFRLGPHFGQLADAAVNSDNMTTNGFYSPSVIFPADRNPHAHTASTTCPGLYTDSYETVTNGFGAGGNTTWYIPSASRNANGVYNSSSNTQGVPAGYNWGSTCTTAPLMENSEGFNGTNSLTLIADHMNGVQGPATGVQQNGYLLVQGYGSGPTMAGINSGTTPGVGVDFVTKYGDSADPTANETNVINMVGNQEFPGGVNEFSGSIAANRQTYIANDASYYNPNGPLADLYALIPDPALGGTYHVGFDSVGLGSIFAMPSAAGAQTAMVPVYYSNGANQEVWRPATGDYERNFSIYAPYINQFASSFLDGVGVQGDSWILAKGPQFATTASTTSGQSTITVASTAGMLANSNEGISGAGIPSNTAIGNISGTTVSLVASGGTTAVNATATATGVVVNGAMGSQFGEDHFGGGTLTTAGIAWWNPSKGASLGGVDGYGHHCPVQDGGNGSTITLNQATCQVNAHSGSTTMNLYTPRNDGQASSVTIDGGFTSITLNAPSGVSIYGYQNGNYGGYSTFTYTAPVLGSGLLLTEKEGLWIATGINNGSSSAASLSSVSLANGGGGLGGTVSFSPASGGTASLTRFSVTSSAAGSATQGTTLFTATFSPALPTVPACSLQGLDAASKGLEADIYNVGSSNSTTQCVWAVMGSTAIPAGTYNLAIGAKLP